jgi:septal ring factor EnvC (AmiA/AmiB activator)
MRTITSRRGFILALSFFACLLMVDALRPVYGRTEEDDLKKQVETLTKKVEDQKKQLDSLNADYQNFKATLIQFDNGINQANAQRDAMVAQHSTGIANINNDVTRQNVVLAQHTTAIANINNALTGIDARLRRGRL